MPFALVTIGLLLVIVGYQNTYKEFSNLIGKDFSGNQNFFYWLFALVIVGGLGYIEDLKYFSRALITLVLVVMILSNEGVFNKFSEALKGLENNSKVVL